MKQISSCHGVIRKTLIAASIAFALAGVVHAQDTANPSSPGSDTSKVAKPNRAAKSGITTLATVVVTAEKRSQLLQTVPVSVTVVSKNLMDRVQANGISDVEAYVPGLNVQPGGVDGNRLIIRGLSTGPNDLSPTVGVVVDDVPFGAVSGYALGALFSPDIDPSDLESIEVLKGPQGTLYGASTLGGLVKYVTRDPSTTEFQGHVLTDYGYDDDGGAPSYMVRAGVNLPLSPGVAGMAISAYTGHTDGEFSDVRTGADGLNSNRRKGGRVELMLTPTDNLTIKASAMFGQNDTPRVGNVTGDAQTLKPTDGEYAGYNYLLGSAQSKYSQYAVDVEYQLPQGISFSSITAWSSFDVNLLGDDTSIFQPAFGPALGPLFEFSSLTDPHTDAFSQEFRLTSASDQKFEWQVGGFFERQSSDYFFNILSSYMYGATPPPALAPTIGLLANYETANVSSSYKEAAVYANGTYHLTPDFDIGIGLRTSRNEQDVVSNNSGYIVDIGAAQSFSQATSSDNVTLESATARWQFKPNAMVYARVASGYRPGGPNLTGTSFQPDTTWNYELGLKGSAFDGTLQGSVDAYYIDWKNIQLNFFNGTSVVIGNAGDAVSRGLEADGIWSPLHDLQITANAAYSDATMSKIKPGAQGGASVGDELPFNSKWSGALRADYSFPLAAAVDGNVGAGLRYKGAFSTTFPGDTGTRFYRLPSTLFFDLRGGITWGHRYDLTFQILNVTNERKLSSASETLAVPVEVADALQQPVFLGYTPGRSFGISFDVKF